MNYLKLILLLFFICILLGCFIKGNWNEQQQQPKLLQQTRNLEQLTEGQYQLYGL
jgi:hypothetical protein